MKNNIEIALKKSTVINNLKLEGQQFYLLTLHRDYNVDQSDILSNLLIQLGQLKKKIIFPVHPRTRKTLSKISLVPSNIIMMEPLGYLDFIVLTNFAEKVITDSGGVQKEAYILRKPCITLRTETEWVETVEERWNLLINPTDDSIAAKICAFKEPMEQKEIFGQNVAEKMLKIINSIQ